MNEAARDALPGWPNLLWLVQPSCWGVLRLEVVATCRSALPPLPAAHYTDFPIFCRFMHTVVTFIHLSTFHPFEQIFVHLNKFRPFSMNFATVILGHRNCCGLLKYCGAQYMVKTSAALSSMLATSFLAMIPIYNIITTPNYSWTMGLIVRCIVKTETLVSFYTKFYVYECLSLL